MAEETSNAGYDVFLCHNSNDKPLVHELAELLRKQNLRVFIDETEIVGGQQWQEGLEAAIETSKAGLILYGPLGLGPWSLREMRAFYSEFVRRGTKVIPVLLPGAPEGLEVPLFLREFHRIDLRTGLAAGLDRLLAGIHAAPAGLPPAPQQGQPKPFRLWNVPPLPNTYQARSELAALRRSLLASSENPLAITGQHTRFALEGMGGVGKTVLATALARDPEVRRAFPGGVYWLTFGQTQTPESLLDLQTRLASAVLGRRVILEASTAVKQREEIEQLLRDTFSDRACLVILDDVWEYEHAKPFNVMGDLGRLFVTTRKREIALSLGADSLDIKQLEKVEAISLLAAYAGLSVEALPPEGPDLTRECGELPLALAAVGSSLRGRPLDQWGMKLKRLRRGVLPKAGHPLPNYSHPSVVAALQASVDDLPTDMRSRYVDLAVFPEDVAIPEAVLRTYWAPEGADEERVAEIVNTFVDRSLARRDDKGRLLLHDLQHDHVRAVAGDLKPIHRRLVDAYRRKGAFHLLEPDGYFHEHIARHVLEADGPAGLRALLLDDCWLATKLSATGVNALLGDFELLDLASDETFRLVHDAIRLSAHVLGRNPEELPSQLLARLRGARDAEFVGFFSQLEAHAVPPTLVPLRPSLAPPGGALICTLEGHGAEVRSVALSEDGKTAVSGSNDNTLKVWNVAAGEELRSLAGYGGSVNAVALSRDGKTVVAGSNDNTLKVWDVATGEEFRTLEGHGRKVTAVALSGDGKTAISASEDKTLKLWDVVSGKALRSLECNSWSLSALALSRNGKIAISGFEHLTVAVWDMVTGKVLYTLCSHGRSVGAVAVSGDGKTAVSGSDDTTLVVWDVATGCGRRLRGHGGRVNAVALSGDGKTAVSGSGDWTVKVWDVATEQGPRREDHRGKVRAVALSLDGKTAVSGSDDGKLMVWDVANRKMLRTLEAHNWPVLAVALGGEGKTAITASNHEALKVWDVASGEALRTLEGRGDIVREIALSLDGKTAISAFQDEPLDVWDVASGKTLRTLGRRHGDWVRAVALSVDGKMAVSGSDKTVKVWDVASGKVLRTLEGHDEWVIAVALSVDGKTAISGAYDNTLRVWDVASGKALRTLKGHGAGVGAVALSEDGKIAVSGSLDNTLKVWNVATAKWIATFSGDAPLICVALQGSFVAAGDNIGHVHLFELKL